jgi:hypothetical protein
MRSEVRPIVILHTIPHPGLPLLEIIFVGTIYNGICTPRGLTGDEVAFHICCLQLAREDNQNLRNEDPPPSVIITGPFNTTDWQ